MEAKVEKVAPDGGWGWVVTFASFAIYFLTFGITAIGGLLMLALTREIFPESRNKAIWIPVLCNGMSRLFAPVAIYFSNKYSYRSVTITGSILLTLGFALSYSATSFDLLFGYFGIIVGIGASFCIYPPSILTTLYFNKHASLANGIYSAGQAFGCIIFPICLDSIFNLVGVRDTFLYLGGMGLQICIAASLLQPVEWHMKTKPKQMENAIEIHFLEEENYKPKTNLSSSFLTNSNFYYLSLGCTAMYLSMAAYPIIIPEFALEQVPQTYTFDRTAYLLSSGATADFITRSMFSWFFDLSFINRTYCFFIGNFVLGLAIIVTIFVPNYVFLLIICVFTGIGAGVCSILVAVAYKENLGENCFGLALTTSSLVSGVLTIVVGSIVGSLKELTGSYDVMFVIIGGYEVGGVFIWLFSRFCAKRRNK